MGMTVNSMASNELQKNFLKLVAGNHSNAGTGNVANKAISEKLQSEIDGLEQGSRNTADMSNLVNVADAGLEGIGEMLGRVQELSVSANSGILSDEDKAIMQNEANELLKGISASVNSVQFNNHNLLDGSFQNANTASYADGSGKKVSIGNMSLEALGLKDLDITNPDSQDILEKAMNTVNSQRAELGATSNVFNHVISSNDITSLNLAASKSQMFDTDMAKNASEAKKSQTMQDYQITMQQRQQNQKANSISVML